MNDSATLTVPTGAPPPPVPTQPDPPPSPAPASPPAPAPSEAPPTKTTQDDFDSRFKDLDEAPPAPAPKPEPAPAAPKPAEKSVERLETKPPAEVKKPAEATEGEPELEPPPNGTFAATRAWGARMAKMATAFRKKLSETEAKVAELEKAPKEHKDVEALTAQLSEATKKLQETEGVLRLTRYERSNEYAEKYKAPWQQAQTRADRDIKQMVVFEPNPDDPDMPPTERPATAADFEEIYNLPLGKAVTAAHKKFGPAQASLVMQHWTRLHELAESAYNAIQENKTRGEQFEKEQTAKQLQEREALNGIWQSTNVKLLEKHAKWFDERDGDTEWNTALQKGREISNLKFTDAYDKLTPQQKVALDAQIYHRAAAFPALRAAVSKLEADLAAANATIESLRGSGPGKPQPSSQEPTAPPKTSMEAFDAAIPG